MTTGIKNDNVMTAYPIKLLRNHGMNPAVTPCCGPNDIRPLQNLSVTNEIGMPVQYYIYDPYGNITNATNDPVNNLTFVGRYDGWRDWDTGLTQFVHRWYDGGTGRWVNKDPARIKGIINAYDLITTAGKGSEINLYEYSLNNPVNRIDKNGLCSKKLEPTSNEQRVKDYLFDFGVDHVGFRVLNVACGGAPPCEATVEFVEAGVNVVKTIIFVFDFDYKEFFPISEGFDGSHI